MKKILALTSILSIVLFCELKAQTGQALNFDGTNDYVACGNVLNSTYTKEAWVMISNASADNSFISGGNDGRHMLWAPAIYGNRLSAGHNGVYNLVQDPTPMVVGVWYHVAVTYNPGTLIMRLYKNGVLVNSATNVPNFTGGTALRLGSFGTGANFLNGSVDDVRIYNITLSGTQIASDYACPLSGTPSGLVQYYRCNQGVAGGNNPGINTLTDAAGSPQSGTLINFALSGATSNWVSPGGVITGVSASISGQTNVSCNAGADGTATAAPSGGGPYTYSWAPSGGTAATATGLAAGIYTCTVTNPCSQTATCTVQITQPPVLVTAPGGNSTICEGVPTTINANASGGTGSYTYLWSPGGMTNANPVVSPTLTTTYTCVVTDANGCTASGTVSVTVNPAPTLSITATPANGIICSGNQATLTASGAQSYSWTGGVTNGVPFAPGGTATYTVTGTGSNGCASTSQSTITVNSCGGATVPCGATITNKNQSLSAGIVPGATQYRFKFYNNVTLALVTQVTQTSRTLSFTATPSLEYGTTYRWTVAVNTGSGFSTESSINCTINFAAPTTTLPCGYSYNRYNGYSAAPGIYGSTGYRFTFYDNVTSAMVAQTTQTSNYIYFNSIPQLQVGVTYKWTVEVRYTNNSVSLFGPASNMNCLVSMNAPTTTVPCNGTYNRNNGYTASPSTSGATGYRFTFYQASVQVGQRAQTSNYIYFTNVNGINNGQTYQWTVEVQYNPGSGAVYGPPSTPCNITFSSSARMGDPNDNSVQPELTGFAVLMYPNPIGSGINPTLTITGADQQEAIVTVLDLNGRTVASYVVFAEGDQYTTELMNFPELVAGMYMMQVQIGDKIQTTKFITE